MSSQIRPYAPRVFVGEIIQPDKQPTPLTYKDIASANNHLHKVINALLKERSGQPLTESENHLIGLHIAAKQWQLRHTHKEQP